MTVEIISFGYGHGPAPDAHITIDVRCHFRDPHINPELRGLTANDDAVVDAVLGTSGVKQTVAAGAELVRGLLAGPTKAPIRVAVGCVGGRHRSAVVAQQIAHSLQGTGTGAHVTHRDLHRPVIAR